jgi:predicted HTH domain antitoxin
MEAVDIKVPRDLIELLGLKNTKNLEQHSKKLLALELYLSEKISLTKAAELSDTNQEEFIKFLKERGHKIRIGPKTLQEAQQEYNALKERLIK